MRKLLLGLSLCLFAMLAPMPETGAVFHGDSFERIDDYLREHLDRSSIPGASYAIIDGGRIVYMNAFGVAGPGGRPMTPQTPLYIGSVGKTFTALAIRQLVNTGRLELNLPVVVYLPDFTLADQGAAQRITIRQLLDHTSGLGNQDGNDPAFYVPAATNADLVRLMAGYQPNRPVGSSFEYSNLNYIVLGRVIEVVSGMSFADYVEANIFAPLDMDHSYAEEEPAVRDGLSAGYRYFFGLPVAVDLEEPAGAVAAGFLMSSAEDMAHYLVAFAGHGRYGDVSIVNPDGRHRPEDLQLVYNIDWLTQSEAKRLSNTETHSGGWLNYSAGIVFMPAEQIGVVVLANANPSQWMPVKDAFALAYDVLRLYTGNPPGPPTLPLRSLYLVADVFLALIALFVVYRVNSLRAWDRDLTRKGLRMGLWLPSLFFDLIFPLVVLLVLPGLILVSSGHFNPIWCWKRLAFQVPDATWAMFVMASALLSVGMLKAGLILRTGRLAGSVRRLQSASVKP